MKAKTHLNAFARGEAAARDRHEQNPFEPGSQEHRNFELGWTHAIDASKAPPRYADRTKADRTKEDV